MWQLASVICDMFCFPTCDLLSCSWGCCISIRIWWLNGEFILQGLLFLDLKKSLKICNLLLTVIRVECEITASRWWWCWQSWLYPRTFPHQIQAYASLLWWELTCIYPHTYLLFKNTNNICIFPTVFELLVLNFIPLPCLPWYFDKVCIFPTEIWQNHY